MIANRKILVVATTFPRREGDDQPRFVLDLCRSIPADYDQQVLAPSGPDCDTEDQVEGISVSRFRYFFKHAETLAYGSGILANLKARPVRWVLVPFFVMGMMLAIRRKLRQFNPDIVHAHWWLPAGFAAAIAIATTKGEFKLLTTCHGGDYFVLGERLQRLRRWVFNRSDRIAMVSPAMRDHAVAQGFSQKTFSVAPMGVNLQEHFVPDMDTTRRGILYVGRLVEKKGVKDLITAWTRASDRVRREGLTIIGTGEQDSTLKAQVRTLGVSDSVTFLGSVAHNELASYYQRAALLVFPSIVSSDNDQEGLGLVAIEAMSCHCPVLASDIGSLGDVVIDDQTGFVYPMGDSTALARRLDELLGAPERCREVAIRGGTAVRERFDWTVVGENYSQLYGSL